MDLTAAAYDEIEMKIKGLRYNSDAGWNTLLSFADVSYNRGISLQHDNSGTTESYAKVVGHLPSVADLTYTHTENPPKLPPYQLQKPSGGSRKARDVTMLWRPSLHEFYVLEEDHVQVAVDLDPAVYRNLLTSETQTLAEGGSGLTSFTVTFGGQTTTSIATAATVQAALEALSTIGAGNVLVAGSADGPYAVTFIGTLAGQNVAQFTTTPTGETGTVTPATTVAGGAATAIKAMIACFPTGSTTESFTSSGIELAVRRNGLTELWTRQEVPPLAGEVDGVEGVAI
jgi:hypothetical protein